MDASKAKKKYKILRRELDRLSAAGSTDHEIETELNNLVANFPELKELQSTVSPSTAAMLAFGESMSDSPPPPPLRKDTDEANRSAEGSSFVVRCLTSILSAASIFAGKRQFNKKFQVGCVTIGFSFALMHRFFEPCREGQFLDPIAATLILHTVYYWTYRVRSPCVYVIADVIPSSLMTFFVFATTSLALNCALSRPVKYFC